jgi:hypothetical protein
MGTQLVPDQKMTNDLQNFKSKLKTSSSLSLLSELRGISSIHELRLIFTQLDSLRDILAKTLEGWQPPQLVVIGQESSGKSTLLERLAMIPIFPKDDNICTRLPIHVRLRNSDASSPTTLEVFNVSSNQTEQAPFVIPTENGQ